MIQPRHVPIYSRSAKRCGANQRASRATRLAGWKAVAELFQHTGSIEVTVSLLIMAISSESNLMIRSGIVTMGQNVNQSWG